MQEDHKRPLIIIGFMAAGKSTAAERLRREFELELYDTDQLIEARLGCSVAEIFANESEEYFRKIEHEVFAELLTAGDNERKIIATGGGLPLYQANKELLKLGEVIYFNTSWQQILERINLTKSTRPLASALNEEQLQILWKDRCETYEEVADYVVTDYDSLKQCLSKIITP